MLRIKYSPPSKKLQPRVKIISDLLGEFIFVPYPQKYDSITDCAEDYLTSNGHMIVGYGEVKGCSIIAVFPEDHQYKSIK